MLYGQTGHGNNHSDKNGGNGEEIIHGMKRYFPCGVTTKRGEASTVFSSKAFH